MKNLFAPGYTLASVIANEFTEATGDLYLSALIEIGLALFLVTIMVNAIARLLVWAVTRGNAGEGALDEHDHCRVRSPYASRTSLRLSAQRCTNHVVTGWRS